MAKMTVTLTDEELMNNIKVFVKRYGVDESLKGFEYMCELIFWMKKTKKYSTSAMQELYHYVASKHGIEEYSVQRQLRYAVTLNNLYGGKLLPVELMHQAQREIETEKVIEKEE